MNKIILSIVMVFLQTSAWASECRTDIELTNVGFSVGTQSFHEAYARVQSLIDSKDSSLAELKGGTIYSSVASRMITVLPVDSLATSSDVMIGDYVLLYDFKTKAPAEVRWFEMGRKYLLYNPAVTPCATNMIPMAYNSLY